MGLISSLSNAISALNVNQQQINTLSQNIANANTEGYSAQVVNQQAAFIQGVGQGVDIGSISRKINDYLTGQIRLQTSDAAGKDILKSYMTQVVNLMGGPGGNSSIDKNVTTFFAALQNLANEPSVTAQTAVVNAATTLASQVSSLATSFENMRLQADQGIGTSINAVNSALQKLHSTNTALQRASATGENASGLLDQRDAALKDIAQYMDIVTTFSSDGAVQVSTTSGTTLLTGSLTQLSYSGASSVQTFINEGKLAPIQVITYSPSGEQVGTPATLATAGISGDGSIKSGLTGGRIQALIQVRDETLPDMLAQLDQFASTLRDQFNALNNQGVSVPPVTSYTGDRLLRGSDTSVYSGSIRIALLNEDGTPAASPYADETNGIQPLLLDLSTIDTGTGPGKVSVDGLINLINEYYGQPEPKVELGNLNNVQLALASDSVPASGNTLSFDFNLNNISANSADFFVTGAVVKDANGNVLDSNPSMGVPTVTLSATNTFSTTAGSNLVTLSVDGATKLVEGDTIYINAASPAGTVGGIPTGSVSGFFKVKNVSGGSFQVEIATINGSTVTNDTLSATGVTAFSTYTTAGAGATLRTGTNGTITANVAGAPNSPYYTVEANVATRDANGNIVTSTISYRVGSVSQGARNDLFGAQDISGGGELTYPASGGVQMTASLVDADGNAVQKNNGLYGNKSGYLKLSSPNGNYYIAIDELDSKQVGTPTSNGTVKGTNQGLMQYFGMNNFFGSNLHTQTGDTVEGSALNFKVTSRIASDPTLISQGKLTRSAQPLDGSAAPNYTYTLASGDTSITQKLAALSTSSVSFAAAGTLPKSGTTFSAYAGLILSQTTAGLTNASNRAGDSNTLLTGYTSQAQNVSGVNLDQELANTVIYQNSYTASTRVITVVSALFQELLGILN